MDDESKFDSDPSTEESYPLLPFTDSPSPERPVFCPPRFKPRRYLSWFHSLLLRNRRATFLASLTAVATLISTIYFRFPSTLHLYLSLLLVSIPTSLVIDLSTLPFDCGKRWSRTRFFAFVIPLASFLFIIIPSLLLPIIPGVQDVKPVATLLSDMPIFPANHTYFFAMNLYNSAALFPTFQTSLLSLIGALGEENVFVSIYESNSKDNTKELLVDLERELRRRNVGCRIEMDNEGERLNDNWAGVKYLADVRNRALKPLDEGINGVNGRTFTRVVWLNDIYYDWKSVLKLLDTHHGAFDIACAFDFIPLGFYDTWVARDLCGNRLKPLWPYFSHSDDIDFLRAELPIPVNSCWSGIAVYDAQWYLEGGLADVVPDSAPNPAFRDLDYGPSTLHDILPLRFRYEDVCSASECLLTAYDLHRANRLAQRPRPRIYMNPVVATTYDYPTYLMYNYVMQWRIVAPWKYLWQDIIAHRLFGWISATGRKSAECREVFTEWALPPPTRYCVTR